LSSLHDPQCKESIIINVWVSTVCVTMNVRLWQMLHPRRPMLSDRGILFFSCLVMGGVNKIFKTTLKSQRSIKPCSQEKELEWSSLRPSQFGLWFRIAKKCVVVAVDPFHSDSSMLRYSYILFTHLEMFYPLSLRSSHCLRLKIFLFCIVLSYLAEWLAHSIVLKTITEKYNALFSGKRAEWLVHLKCHLFFALPGIF